MLVTMDDCMIGFVFSFLLSVEIIIIKGFEIERYDFLISYFPLL